MWVVTGDCVLTEWGLTCLSSTLLSSHTHFFPTTLLLLLPTLLLHMASSSSNSDPPANQRSLPSLLQSLRDEDPLLLTLE